MQIIPMQNIGAYNFQISLEGRVYRFKVKWNSRGEYWTLTITDIADNDLVKGLKLVLNTELLRRYKKEIPPGGLIPIDSTGKLSKIGRNDWGDAKLVYITSEELNGTV